MKWEKEKKTKRGTERKMTEGEVVRHRRVGGGGRKKKRLTSTFIIHYITAFYENAPLRLTSVGETPIALFGTRETPSSCFIATTILVLDSRGCTPNAARDVRHLP